MPRQFVVLTSGPEVLAELVHAAGQSEPVLTALVLDGGAALQLRDGTRVVLTVQCPIDVVPGAVEVRRLLPWVDFDGAGPLAWTEAWLPFGEEGIVGEELLRKVADRLGGFTVGRESGAMSGGGGSE